MLSAAVLVRFTTRHQEVRDERFVASKMSGNVSVICCKSMYVLINRPLPEITIATEDSCAGDFNARGRW